MKKYIFRPAAYLLPVAIVMTVYFTTPDEIILTENAHYSAYPNGFVKLTSVEGEAYVDTETVGVQKMHAELFGAVPIKSVQVSVVPERYVTVSGEAIGVRLYSDGIMVVNVESGSGAKSAGIKKGDVITYINGAPAESVEKLSAQISSAEENTLTVTRNGHERTLTLRGEKDKMGYTAGMWVRDSTAGIGTMSFYDGENNIFGALGHAICDSDTGAIVPLAHGTISSCRIRSVKAGESGEPGELVGSIGSEVTGCVLINSELGLYGLMDEPVQGREAAVATRFLVKEGAAELLCDVDGAGVKSYSVEIEQVSKTKNGGNKSMVIRVTDEELIAVTGGIVQGMSGSPILQNGRLVGAVTHVFINDPRRGYAVFAESMLTLADETTEFDGK